MFNLLPLFTTETLQFPSTTASATAMLLQNYIYIFGLFQVMRVISPASMKGSQNYT